VTDFVANCGGVVGSMMDRAVDKGVIWDILNTSYRAKVAALHSQSLSSGEPIGYLARREAEQRISSWGREKMRHTRDPEPLARQDAAAPDQGSTAGPALRGIMGPAGPELRQTQVDATDDERAGD
jgi:hypothetical protein